MTTLRVIVLGLRFLLEVAAVIAFAYWGFTTGEGAAAWLLGLGAPLAAIVVWGLFVAPRAVVSLPEGVRLGIRVLVFAFAVAAVFAAGRPGLALVFGVALIADVMLEQLWE
jgi:hypothetical protein